MINKFGNSFIRFGNRLISVGNNLRTFNHDERMKSYKKWREDNGDFTLRLDYPELTSNDIVFDLGGYIGQWTSDIFSKYRCNIYVFEIVNKYFNFIQNRFLKNDKITVFPFGLGGVTKDTIVSLSNDSSSIIRNQRNQEKEHVKIVRASSFLSEKGIDKIGLIKINIEGAEYDLLEELIESKWIEKIDNIQVQFHDFSKDSKTRMQNIQDKLSETHHLTYQYPFIWENWKIK